MLAITIQLCNVTRLSEAFFYEIRNKAWFAVSVLLVTSPVITM